MILTLTAERLTVTGAVNTDSPAAVLVDELRNLCRIEQHAAAYSDPRRGDIARPLAVASVERDAQAIGPPLQHLTQLLVVKQHAESIEQSLVRRTHVIPRNVLQRIAAERINSAGRERWQQRNPL
jgi:hypothetical protein